MKSPKIFLFTAALCLISWSSSEGIITREYLPAVVNPTPVRFLHNSQYPSYYKPSYYNQYQQQYYPSYYPQYTNGILGGYHQQQSLLGQHISTGSSLGLTGLGSYYPNVNVGVVPGYKPKLVVDTVYDANGGYVYGKKK